MKAIAQLSQIHNVLTTVIAGCIYEVQFLRIIQFYSLAVIFANLNFVNCVTATYRKVCTYLSLKFASS